MKIPIFAFVVIGLATFVIYLPILFNPQIVLGRGNDLQEQFWPIFNFIQQQTWQHHSFPLWNNLFSSGLPLLPDPQFAFFYPPNLLFLFLPTNIAFITSFFLHTLIGGMGIYLASKVCFKFSGTTSVFTSIIYIFSPKLGGYLEAGHYGLVASWAWFPYIIIAVWMLAKNPKLSWSILLSTALAGIFFTHSITFILAAITAGLFFITILVLDFSLKKWFKPSTYFIISIIITFGLTAITFLPQIEWIPQTTRLLLIHDRDVYPKWLSLKEFIQNIFYPWINGLKDMQNIDTEKWLSMGFGTSLLALVGFLRLQIKYKIFLLLGSLIIIFISTNNASPIYHLLISQDWFVLMRVSTRIWFLQVLIIVLLAGFGFESLSKIKLSRKYLVIFSTLAILEMLSLSWSRLFIPIAAQSRYVSKEIYQFLKSDRDRFRIFCVNRCLSQQDAAKANLELIEGYNTLQQMNYYKHIWQLSGGYWNYYTLALPPTGIYTFQKPQPDAISLGLYNTKYVVSPYQLTDDNFNPINKFGNFYLYKNMAFRQRAYFKSNDGEVDPSAPIIIYSPNYIKVDTSAQKSKSLILSEVYSKGWHAYLNGKEEVDIQETPNALRQVDINKDTKFVEFEYSPNSFKIGSSITIVTILFILLVLTRINIISTFKRNRNSRSQ